MRFSILCAVILLPAIVARADPAHLDGIDLDPEGAWAARFSMYAASPIALDTGMPVGALLELNRRLGDGPFHAGLVVSFSSTTEANPSWELRHRHFSAGLVGGVSREHGVARLFAQVGAGVVYVSERARRHQYDRLLALNVPDLEKTGAATGATAWGDLGVAVQLRAHWQIAVTTGPTWTLLPSGGRLGLTAGLGVRHAF